MNPNISNNIYNNIDRRSDIKNNMNPNIRNNIRNRYGNNAYSNNAYGNNAYGNNTITDNILKYYYNILISHLSSLKMFNNNNKKKIMEYYNELIEDFKINNETNKEKQILKKIEDFLILITENYNEEEIKEKIDILIFKNFSKKNIISPYDIFFCDCEILKNIINSIIIIDIKTNFNRCINSIKKINNLYNANNIKSINERFIFTKKIKNDLNILFDEYIKFYLYLLNKYDNDYYYVFPLLIRNNNVYEIVSSTINKNKNKNESKHEILSLESSFGGADFYDTEIDKSIENIKEMTNDMAKSQPLIKNNYDIDDIKRIESFLENANINNLIKTKQLKLNKNFKEMLQDINKYNLEIEETEENEELLKENKIKNKEFFNDFFKDTDDEIIKNMYNLYENEDDKKNFLEYIVDKISYNKFNNKNSSIISVADNIFDKIKTSTFPGNIFNLDDSSMQFILMLETLESMKTVNKEGNDNITVNINREDLTNVKVNGVEVDVE